MSMLVFNLSETPSTLHDWHSAVDYAGLGFNAAIEAHAKTLPAGKYLLAVLSVDENALSAESGHILRLARVTVPSTPQLVVERLPSVLA